MHNEIMEADTIVFLGFAFHPLNMRLLAPPSIASPRRIFATTLGMSDADETVIENDIWRTLGKRELKLDEPVKPEFAKVTGAEFFQQYFRSMSASVDDELELSVPSFEDPSLPPMPSWRG